MLPGVSARGGIIQASLVAERVTAVKITARGVAVCLDFMNCAVGGGEKGVELLAFVFFPEASAVVRAIGRGSILSADFLHITSLSLVAYVGLGLPEASHAVVGLARARSSAGVHFTVGVAARRG